MNPLLLCHEHRKVGDSLEAPAKASAGRKGPWSMSPQPSRLHAAAGARVGRQLSFPLSEASWEVLPQPVARVTPCSLPQLLFSQALQQHVTSGTPHGPPPRCPASVTHLLIGHHRKAHWSLIAEGTGQWTGTGSAV